MPVQAELRPDITLEILNERGRQYFPGFMGVEIQAVTPGEVFARMAVQPHHLAPNGFLHAAAVIALADTCCGYGTIAHLPAGAQSFTTVELKANFLGTVQDGAIHCRARGEHLGRNTHVWDAVVTNDAGDRKLALFRCTQMILWPR